MISQRDLANYERMATDIKNKSGKLSALTMLEKRDPIAIAKYYVAYRRDVERNGRLRCAGPQDDMRDRIAGELNCRLNGSSLDRLARLLKLPLGVQAAISGRRISQTIGQAILQLPPCTQNAIALDLDGGINKTALVAKYNLGPCQKSTTELRFIRFLTVVYRALPSLPETLRVPILRDNSRIDLDQMLDKVIEVLEELRDRLAEVNKAARPRPQTKRNGRRIHNR